MSSSSSGLRLQDLPRVRRLRAATGTTIVWLGSSRLVHPMRPVPVCAVGHDDDLDRRSPSLRSIVPKRCCKCLGRGEPPARSRAGGEPRSSPSRHSSAARRRSARATPSATGLRQLPTPHRRLRCTQTLVFLDYNAATTESTARIRGHARRDADRQSDRRSIPTGHPQSIRPGVRR